MKVATPLFTQGDHQWIAIARDPKKPDHLIDTIEYVILKKGKACLLDPGGQEVFPAVFSAFSTIAHAKDIEFLFASHQDPDICSSLPLWLSANPSLKCYLSWLWATFVPHFGGNNDTFINIPDEGMSVQLAGALPLEFIPAHYLHSSGNFHVYDPTAKILFSGDIGAALLPEGTAADLFVKDFDAHTKHMRGFHQRWIGSNEAKNNWVDRVSRMQIDLLCPQHGSIFQGKDVERFLQWLRDLPVGSAARHNAGAAIRTHATA